MTGGGDMLPIAPRPSRWVLAKGPLCASVAVLVLLGTLLLAGGAHAAASAGEPAGETSSSTPAEPTPEASSPTSPVVEPTPEASSPTSPVVEPTPEASSPTPPVAEPAPETPTPTDPVVEPVSEAPTPTPAPVVDPTPEAPALAPVVEPVKEVKEAPATDPTKETTEVPTVKPTLEQGAGSPSSSPSATSSDATAAAPEVSSAQGGPIAAVFPADVSEEVTTGAAESSASTAALARKIVAQRAEAFNRELGGLGSSLADGYTAPGLNDRRLLVVAIVDDLVAGTAGRPGAPVDDDPGGSTGESPPIAPPPGPTPNGAFGGAAGGGSGVAPLAGFPAVAGHLLLGAPLAMRRLRLSFQPWLTAFFVLIPERPG
jgi:hypothetical protein